MKLETFLIFKINFLDVFEGVEYESAIIPKFSFLTGGGEASESSITRDPNKLIGTDKNNCKKYYNHLLSTIIMEFSVVFRDPEQHYFPICNVGKLQILFYILKKKFGDEVDLITIGAKRREFYMRT